MDNPYVQFNAVPHDYVWKNWETPSHEMESMSSRSFLSKVKKAMWIMGSYPLKKKLHGVQAFAGLATGEWVRQPKDLSMRQSCARGRRKPG